MTKNQLEFAQLKETQRANRAKERETQRANMVNESHRLMELTNTYVLGQKNLEELQRSNIAREMETHRSNVARETETKRYNIASLDEVSRHNLQTEALGRQNVALGYAQLAELQRSNLARELETNRSNLAREAETQRSNLVREGQQEAQISEMQRHNRAAEATERYKADIQGARVTDQFNLAKEQMEVNLAISQAQIDNAYALGLLNAGSNLLGNIGRNISLVP